MKPDVRIHSSNPFRSRTDVKGSNYMNRVFSILIIGGLFVTASTVPASLSASGAGRVEASPTLAFVAGTVKADDGAPLAGATVGLFEASLNGRLVKSLKTDVQGRFNVGIVPGTYTLRAEADGFQARFKRISLDRAQTLMFNFALRRTDTLVQKRGDRDDIRWIGRSVPRSVLHYDEEAIVASATPETKPADRLTELRPTVHGVVQMLGTSSATRNPQSAQGFFGTNFAVAGSLNGNVEVALVGQAGAGNSAMQRLALIAAMRPDDRHHVTASLGYGRLNLPTGGNPFGDEFGAQPALEQASVSMVDSWQAFQPLLIVYGVDYSRFVGAIGRNRDSLLPRVAVQYSPSASTQINAALTPGRDFPQFPAEGLNTETINTSLAPDAGFSAAPAEVAFAGNDPLIDRSRRYELGVQHLFEEGRSSLEATAFYDVISGHGVGVLALPLEATPNTQAAFQQVAHQVAAMNGTARGMRVMYSRRLGEYVTASAGYSFGRGQRFNRTLTPAVLDQAAPADLFRGGFFQVASAKVDLDLSRQSGTTVSTVIRLSPGAVVFAIDPFAGRMSVYDPNISVYVTQELPSFGLPLHWQAIVDVRNLLNQSVGADDSAGQIVAARLQRSLRGGIAFRW